ncbi:MAG: hypothetical protein HC876_07235 [Chloroflexaceae bacterium]|nr:hypothetical protein [Chloroflexaceae bacterium]
MVPAAFVIIDALPLSPNGKLDRRALPEPDAALLERDRPYLAPRTPVEVMIARIWGDVLGVERVGIDDGFFALGGHSLRATQIVARLREAFAVDIPLRLMFEDVTVARLAEAIETLQWMACRPSEAVADPATSEKVRSR